MVCRFDLSPQALATSRGRRSVYGFCISSKNKKGNTYLRGRRQKKKKWEKKCIFSCKLEREKLEEGTLLLAGFYFFCENGLRRDV